MGERLANEVKQHI